MNSACGQRGFSLVELMVAVTLGLLVMLVLSEAMVSSSQARPEADQATRQVESGRYAVPVLSADLALAGYYEVRSVAHGDAGSKPNPCATDIATLKTAMPLHGKATTIRAPRRSPRSPA
jgi:type IV pilus assembly protein PilW